MANETTRHAEVGALRYRSLMASMRNANAPDDTTNSCLRVTNLALSQGASDSYGFFFDSF
jgi:hypothetical protein